MSSRKSNSSRINNKQGVDMSITNTNTNPINVIMTSIIVIIYNLLILGYLITLEGQKCKCIRDWRHDFLKYFSTMMIIYSIILIILSGTTYKNNIIVMITHHILMILSFVNIWCLYTYIGDLDRTQCSCALIDQRNMHYFLYIWRYILVGMIILGLLLIIASALTSK
jgi:hypothetical protein